jgi:tetratricopeptide (TPR) repeat protein
MVCNVQGTALIGFYVSFHIMGLRMNVIVFFSIFALASIPACTPTLTMVEAPTNDAPKSTPDKGNSYGYYEKELLPLLKAREFETLESATRQVQERFENGALSEIQLRNIYRQFYDLDEQDLAKVEAWKSAISGSYAAHLIRGVHFKRKAGDARGGKYLSQTPPDKIQKMQQFNEIAFTELTNSLDLTEKPFLSVFQLLEISKSRGDKDLSTGLVIAANKMLPSNTLARGRFMLALTPRWGGSYEEMKQFISRSKKEDVSPIGLSQLEAIMYDDIGMTYLEQGDRQNATTYFLKALALAKSVGGDFRKDWLLFSNDHVCRDQNLKKYC